MASSTQVTTSVRRQYEQYPYPKRDPEDEKKRLLMTGLDDLAALNYYCYGGRRDFRSGFRALVAGGGTGDSVVFLAQQLRNTDARIVYVDLSTASMSVARERIAARGLTRMVQWVHGSLLDLPSMRLAPFDYVNCSGVLHHLADPPAGLAALRAVMKDDGALGLMVYGLYGRTGVYQMQQLMRLINGDEEDQALKLERTRGLLKDLPRTNWFSRGSELFQHDVSANDVECYDLFLHSQDRAYSVPQLYEFLGTSGLHLQEFCFDHRALYNPLLLIQDADLRQTVAGLPRPTQQAIAEVLCGTLIKHACWATPAVSSKADDLEGDQVPYFTRLAKIKNVREAILTSQEAVWSLPVPLPGGVVITLRLDRTPEALRFVELADGAHTMSDIVGDLMVNRQLSKMDAWQSCLRTLGVLRSLDLVVLRHRTTPLPAGCVE